MRHTTNSNSRAGVWAKRIALLLGALVILAIVAVPVPRKRGGDRGSIAFVRNETRQLENAIRAYHSEYFDYPLPAGADGPHVAGGLLMEVLMDQDVPRAQLRNRRGIAFFEPSLHTEKEGRRGYHTPTGTYRDFWGTPYEVFMDLDGDEELSPPDYYGDRFGRGGRVRKTTFVHSAGPDRDFGNARDNVTSWD